MSCEHSLSRIPAGGLFSSPASENRLSRVHELMKAIRQSMQMFGKVSRDTLSQLTGVDLRINVNFFCDGVINLNYSREAIGLLHPLEEVSRGLYLTEQEILLLPMVKFYNYGEQPEKDKEIFSKNIQKITFYEKIDGTMIVMRRKGNRVMSGTRSVFLPSFEKSNESTSVYLSLLPAYFQQQAGGFEWMDENLTYTFELVLKESEEPFPKAVNHAPGLYFLAARDVHTGQDFLPESLPDVRDRFNPVKEFSFESIQDAARFFKNAENVEGVVAVLTDVYGNIYRLKLKSDWWFEAHRRITKKKQPFSLAVILKQAGTSPVSCSALAENPAGFFQSEYAEAFLQSGNLETLDDYSALFARRFHEHYQFVRSLLQSHSPAEARKKIFTEPVPNDIEKHAAALLISAFYEGKQIKMKEVALTFLKKEI